MKAIYAILGAAALMLAVPVFSQDGARSGKGYVMVQCKARNSKNPAAEKWKDYPCMTVDSLPCANAAPDRLNRYGSLEDGPTFKATGFYRTEKYNGRWITVDPVGKMHIDAVVCTITRGSGQTQKASFAKKFKSRKDWMEKTARMLYDYGFNGAGNWSETDAIREYNAGAEKQLSYCPFLGLMSSYGKSLGVTTQRPGNTGYPNQCILCFDPGFEKFCEKKIAEAADKYRGDPNVMGYFSDNEMPLSLKNLEGYLDLPEGDYGRKAAEKWMKKKRVRREDLTDELRSEFAGYVADTYYSIVSKLLKKYDPDHMYLGSRLHGGAKYIPEVMKAAAKWCDVISINYYGGWDVKDKDIERWESWVDRPFIITEFYTKGMDSGLANTTGAGWTVHTQKDRGLHYENFIIKLLQTRQCVGWHWFKYIDNDPTAKGVDPSNIDSNKGLVDNHYEPYKDLAERMKRVNEVRYTLLKEFSGTGAAGSGGSSR